MTGLGMPYQFKAFEVAREPVRANCAKSASAGGICPFRCGCVHFSSMNLYQNEPPMPPKSNKP
jgi:hypothetical protein